MDFAAARDLMVETQIRTNRVTHPEVLAAMRKVPREVFVPKSKRAFAYVDEDIEIDRGRFLMEPMVLARLLDSADPRADDLALVVAAAPGYAAAVLASMAATVFALEAEEDLARQMEAQFRDLQLDNVLTVTGPHAQGRREEQPFDLILINGAVRDVPAALLDQLAEGGRLVTVIQEAGALGRAVLYLKRGGVTSHRILFDANLKPAPGFEQEEGFVF